MKKNDMLDMLNDIRKSHQNQMLKIENLLEGKNVSHPTEVDKFACRSGQLLYPNQEEFSNILGLQLFEKLDIQHTLWHEEYSKIHAIFFKEKKGLFSKMFGKKLDSLELDKAKMYYKEMLSASENFYHVLDIALRRISALSDAKFKD
jgi:hypothetical protein